ncbi:MULTISPECIES: GNAT family N-acetyltransferase [unclassified Streptomyces]|uniref:GNAT family N-acetyltransferase n=1 Tax=unclassified Streptomyces TaxID=2593676 RepID=UPI0032432584
MIPRSWRYAWNNSGGALVLGARGAAEALARPRLTRSVPQGQGPVLAYAGLDHELTYVLPFLEQRRGTPSVRTRTTTSWAELAGGRAAADTDILAVGHRRSRVPDPLPRHSLLLPFRITLTVPLEAADDPAAAVLRRISRKARQQHARELRSRVRTLEVSRNEADFDSFYDHMHVPTMGRRHGDAARSEAKESARACIFRHGAMFFLCESGRRVAGMLCRLEGRTLVIRLAGVDGGGEEAYRSGTYMALFILILQWAAEQGFTRVDLSGGEPFLSKGTFQFKRKMHPHISLPPNHFRDRRLLVRVLRDSPQVRDFLVANPMLTLDDDGALWAVHFHDADRPPRLDLRWQCPGVDGQRLIDLDAFLAGLPARQSDYVLKRSEGGL